MTVTIHGWVMYDPDIVIPIFTIRVESDLNSKFCMQRSIVEYFPVKSRLYIISPEPRL